MASQRTLARLDVLIWALIFGGLFLLVLGIAAIAEAARTGWSLAVVGSVAALTGAVLIFVRARLCEDPPTGAEATTDIKETRK